MTCTLAEIFASLTANGCRKTGRNRWQDETHSFRIVSADAGRFRLEATPLRPVADADAAIRAALVPFLRDYPA